MEIIAPLVVALMLAGSAVTMANGRALMGEDLLAERFARNGIVATPGAPAVDAPEGFIRRVRRRERVALFWSAALALAGALLAVFAGLGLTGYLLVFVGALLGRTAAVAVLGAREARLPDAGPRTSRGRRLALSDYVPGWGIGLFAALQVVACAAALVLIPGDASRPWVVAGALVALVVGVAAVALAAWLAAAPLRAADRAELGWGEAQRREDIMTLVPAGPVAALAVFSLGGAPWLSLPWWLLVGYLVALVAVGWVVESASQRLVRGRVRDGAGVDAQR